MSKPIIRNPDGNIWFILGAAANALRQRPKSLERFNARTSAAMRDGKTDYHGMLRIVMEFVDIEIDEPEEDDNAEGDDDLGLPPEPSDSEKMIEIISATSRTQGIPYQVHRRSIDLGNVVITNGASDCLSEDVIHALLTVHGAGCWGNGLDAEDEAVNELALPPHNKTLSDKVQPMPEPNSTKVSEGHRLLGCWRLGSSDVYVITEGCAPTDTPLTTVMLTFEY